MTEAPVQTDTVTLTIDGVEVTVPKNTLIIRAAEQLGVQVPRFCDHPLLDPVGACRQCLVDVEGQRKPLTACTTTVADGMVVRTQMTSDVARKAQEGTLELLLINHPLDCPICDKGGECPLQNQTLTNGPGESRFVDKKRTYPKPLAISSQVLLDRERCVLCARCTRFSQQIAGDPFIELFERGALEQVAIYTDEPFESYFSGNTVQICPVGALTGASYRFRARPFDLVSTPGACEHCASGCAMRVDARRNTVLRRLAGNDPDVNEEWNCDKGRWAFTYASAPDRLTVPLVRDGDGLREASWPEAVERAAGGLGAARRSGVLTGGRLTVEDAYAYAKLARLGLKTNNVDFRTRAGTAEEDAFLVNVVAGRPLAVTYADLEAAPAVLLAGLEPEEESPIVFLRLRKAARKRGTKVYAVTPVATESLRKMWATPLLTPPGDEVAALTAAETADALRGAGSVILVGERLAETPGALAAAVRLAETTGAKLGWVPRRAGDRGALEAGAFPSLLPGGRPVADDDARMQVAATWGVGSLPAEPGLDTAGMLAAAGSGQLDALLVAGVDPYDLPDPAAALAALDSCRFLVSVELRRSAVTDRAHVVLPVASMLEKDGAFLDWEGRVRSFQATLRQVGLSLPDHKVVGYLARELGVHLGFDTAAGARDELSRLSTWGGERGTVEAAPADPPRPEAGEAVLATWSLLLDHGRLQDGEPHLAGTARSPRATMSATTAKEAGVEPGGRVTVSTDRGSVTLPVTIADMPDRVVHLPANSRDSHVRRDLAPGSGAVVRLAAAAEEVTPS
ncbi:MAG TPA: NADH-quinone oxidoreductase subunit G [Mycobacteriales bacterium]|jgi:NADH-quinone oxidoreductase subunit G|nr:NADH-quinone oxidoreductase subunit G [Mycobacteriales bacterium]